MTPARTAGVIIAAVLGTAGLAGCSSESTPSAEARYCQVVEDTSEQFSARRPIDMEAGSVEESDLVAGKNRVLVARRDAAPSEIADDWTLYLNRLRDGAYDSVTNAEVDAAVERIDAFTMRTCGSSDITAGMG